MKRVLALAMVSILASACSGDEQQPATNQALCSQASAEEVRQVIVGPGGFQPSCVAVPVNTPLFFVNGDSVLRKVESAPESADAINAELPNRDSAFSYRFTRVGEHMITSNGQALTVFSR